MAVAVPDSFNFYFDYSKLFLSSSASRCALIFYSSRFFFNSIDLIACYSSCSSIALYATLLADIIPEDTLSDEPPSDVYSGVS